MKSHTIRNKAKTLYNERQVIRYLVNDDRNVSKTQIETNMATIPARKLVLGNSRENVSNWRERMTLMLETFQQSVN